MCLAHWADLTRQLEDPPKRVNFLSVQNSQTTHCDAYTPMPLRTGYERVMAHRVDPLYAKTADKDGTIESVTDKVITMSYKDGTTETFEIGKLYGNWAGKTIPHTLTPVVKAGQRVKKGDVVYINTKYFVMDTLYPNQALYKTSVMGAVAFMETNATLEDSCEISPRIAEKLITMSTHIRPIKVTFDQEIRNLLTVGDEVDNASILCTIHNLIEGNSSLFDDAALDTLKNNAKLSPKAKYHGKIEKIEVVYAGEPEDMSATLRTIVDKADEVLYRTRKQLKKNPVDGRVDAGFRVSGIPMDINSAVIKVYITGPSAMGIGDKLVVGHQLKSIVGRVLPDVNETEDGLPIDVVFGYQSVANRIVASPELMGTTNALLLHIGKLAVAAYRK